jgi:hypothetical protein
MVPRDVEPRIRLEKLAQVLRFALVNLRAIATICIFDSNSDAITDLLAQSGAEQVTEIG